MTVNPEQVKLEEKVLEGNLANIRSNVDVAILVSDSLGKTRLKRRLELLKVAIDSLED